MSFLADQPELLALAGLASVSATKIAAAYNDPEAFFEHLSLAELDRVREASERLGTLALEMAQAVDPLLQRGRELVGPPDAD